jgi:hypothetical protein
MTLIDERKIYNGKTTGALFVFIGVLTVGFGTAVVFVSADRLLAYVLMGLPASLLGLIELLLGSFIKGCYC